MTAPSASAIEATGHSRGVLRTDIMVRLVDVSSQGCLLESSRPLAEGTVGSVHLEFGDVTLSEVLRVARCQQLDRAGTLFRVGAQFLQAERAEVTSLRHAVFVMRNGQKSVFVEYVLPQHLPASTRKEGDEAVFLKGART